MAQRVKEGFSFDHQGVPVTLRRGQLFADDHPYVKGHERQFEPADDAAIGATRSTTDAMETATAAPGTARTISRQDRGDRRGPRGTADKTSGE